MARGLNHVYLLGALARDPELRYTPAGMAVLDLVVAGDDHIVGNDGQARVMPWYHRTSLLGKQAEALLESDLKAGQPVFVEGTLEFRTWETPEGAKRSQVSVKALRVEAALAGSRSPITVTDSQGGFRLTNAVNEVAVIGNLIRDAELRCTPAGDAVTTASIAVNESWKNKNGDWQEKTHFVEINLWRDLAEAAGALKKGVSVFTMGRLVNESWTDKEGNKRSNTRVEGRRFEALTRGEKTVTPVQAEVSKPKVDRTRAGVRTQFEPTSPDDDMPF